MENVAESTRSEIQAILANVGHDWGFLAELVEMLEVDSFELAAKVQKAVDEENPEELMEEAHALKSILSHVTQGPSFQLAAALESAGRNRDLTGTREPAQQLDAALQELISALQHVVATEGER
ncbi:MAG: Hpt domain-containing protein [Thermoanaerobaculia bacterium]|nr:Hpt domain-containing protein [Thermoanaerobaculia bacterium]